MINSQTSEYYRSCYGAHFQDYLKIKKVNDTSMKCIAVFFALSLTLVSICAPPPVSAKTVRDKSRTKEEYSHVYLEKNFEENIKNKYKNAYVSFPTAGIAHIKKTKYINSRPIKINIAEINTNVNPYLSIKPEIAGTKLNSKATVRKMAQKNGAIVAINGGFFKPQTGVPLGALVIDGKVLTGPIYNRVGIAIFEEAGKTKFKLSNIVYDIHLKADERDLKADNINQPRMLCTHKLIYTSDWGKYSPYAPKSGWNALIRGGSVIKISANPIELNDDDIVFSADRQTIRTLASMNNIKLEIELNDEIKSAKHVIGAGPYLVRDGQIYVDSKTQKLGSITGKNPRSAIGFDEKGTLIIVTVDGREKASVGMTLTELASLMKSLGCKQAMNFDGGSSSTMYVNGKVVNSAVGREGISVSNALAIFESNPSVLSLSSI